MSQSEALLELAEVMEKHGVSFECTSSDAVDLDIYIGGVVERLPAETHLWSSSVDQSHIRQLAQQLAERNDLRR